MTIHLLNQPPEPFVADALERFEQKFIYPLGVGRTFSISHGRDYSRFFRAIDHASGASFVAIGEDGEIRGTLGAAVRPVQFPSGECHFAAYLGDLKTVAGPGSGRTLRRLAGEAAAWCKAHGAVIGYGVVMDGTRSEPSDYTGKLGIHAFRRVRELCILRLPVETSESSEDRAFDSGLAAVQESFRTLAMGAFAPLGGDSGPRSCTQPVALLAPDSSACGILEDTRLAKRLLSSDRKEMVAAHLSSFAFANPAAGAQLIRQALVRCASRKIAPAMFVAVPSSQAAAITALLCDLHGTVKAPAAIYGTEPEFSHADWNIGSSEI
jgi:hypothetical protein